MKTVPPDHQVCNNCGALFRVRTGRESYGSAKGVSVKAEDIDPCDPRCPDCRRRP